MLPAPLSRRFPAASQHLGLLPAGIPSMESLSPLRAPAAPLCPPELGIRSGNEAQAEVRGFLKAAVVNPGFPSRENPSRLRALAGFCPFLAVFKAAALGSRFPLEFPLRSGVLGLDGSGECSQPRGGSKVHVIVDRQFLPLDGGEQGWGEDNAAVGGRQKLGGSS